MLPGETPASLGDEFVEDPLKRGQWETFLRKGGIASPGQRLDEVTAIIRSFLMPLAAAAAQPEVFDSDWPAGGPWKPNPPPR
jgi:hypothetical protein